MSGGALIARVVPDVTGLDKQFDYLVPESLVDRVAVGSVVRVPLGPRRVRAWVVEVLGSSEVETLKPLAAWSGCGPTDEIVELARWAAHRWAGRLRPFLLAASPDTLVKKPVEPPPVRRLPSETAEALVAAVGLDRRDSLRVLGPLGGVLRVPPCTDAIADVVAACCNGPLLLIVPEVDAAALLAARLRGLGVRVALLPRDWAIAAGGADVVIGTRTAVWGPCRSLGGVMVLDEHDESLQEERSPTWNARDVALERARRAGVPCWLVSPTPSMEALNWADDRLVRPSRVEERNGWPFIEVVDRSAEESPTRSPVTRALLDLCRDPRQRVVCVLNTKGRARRLICGSCHALVTCAACGSGVAQNREAQLECARCAAVRPPLCAACGSTRLSAVGIGVSRLRDELEAAVRRPVVEVSSETASDAVGDAPRDAVFLGTEAVLHRVPSATAVVFVDIDDELLAPRFRANEEATALIVRAARLVGGRRGGGRIVLQTNQPRHEVIQAVLHADPSRLVGPERERRKLLGLPPFRALAAVTGTLGASWLHPTPLGLEVAGPVSGRWLVRADGWQALGDGLAALGPRPRGVRVEVDPRRV